MKTFVKNYTNAYGNVSSIFYAVIDSNNSLFKSGTLDTNFGEISIQMQSIGEWLIKRFEELEAADNSLMLVSCDAGADGHLAEEFFGFIASFEKESDTQIIIVSTERIKTVMLKVGSWAFIYSRHIDGLCKKINTLVVKDGVVLLQLPAFVSCSKGTIDVTKSIEADEIIFWDNDVVLNQYGLYNNNGRLFTGTARALIITNQGVFKSYTYHLKIELNWICPPNEKVLYATAQFDAGVLISQTVTS